VLTSPPFLELDRGEIPQGGMDALVHVDVVEKPAQLAQSISVILIVGQVNFLFLDGAHEPLRVAVLQAAPTSAILIWALTASSLWT